jgi:hypothetical protein
MPRLKKTEILRTDLLEQPCVRAWRELGPRRVEPEQIEVLKGEKKSSVYRLLGVGPGNSAVIAKQCKRRIAGVERAIYEEVLTELPVTTPRYYGSVDGEDERYCWLFLEDAGGEMFSWENDRHQVLATRWLGTMHTCAADVAAAAELPDRGPGHYLDHLRRARENILRYFDNPALDAGDRELLEEILSRLDSAESNWSEVEALCEEMPRTLVHGDIRGANARVRRDSGEAILIPFDWEMAGWGVPPVDLRYADVDVYAATVGGVWPRADVQTLKAWVNVGNLLRGSIAPISWRSSLLAYEWAHREMNAIRAYYAVLCDSIRDAGLQLR